MIFACPKCNKSCRLPDHFVGRKTECPHCGRIVRAPDVVRAEPVETPSAARSLFAFFGVAALAAISWPVIYFLVSAFQIGFFDSRIPFYNSTSLLTATSFSFFLVVGWLVKKSKG
jgi:hypothetical protein